jgi:hypothetical protein
MTWAMMWATGTMEATMPATTPVKGMARMLAGRGGGLLAEDAVVVVAAVAAAAAVATAAAAAAYCWGRFLFIVKIFLSGIFMCGGNRQVHTSPHTPVMLEVCRHTFGWGWYLSPKIVVCKTQKLSSKKAWQPMLELLSKC